ncbi:MAG TPA: DUF3467 domain-containing protein [Phycisphaerae bacterium]|nr:DUF3467 domain-containing protein [Phycisphaerae bacterium]HPS52099.1 DUF3467 domain-containing protein [Phycisphaerae bacterium]
MVEENAQNQQVKLTIDQRDMHTFYANAFQTNVTPEELFVSFGTNQPIPAQDGSKQPQIMLKLESRIAMNYYTAKRLAIQLSQAVQGFEERFGVLELDINKRTQGKK